MSGPQLDRLTVDGREKPLGLDEPEPRFGWIVVAGDHHVQPTRARVAVTRDDGTPVAQTEADGEDTRAVVAAGWEPLTRYRWRVEVEAVVDGAPTVLGAESWFETGLLATEDWDGSTWIGGAATDDPRAAPLLRREVEIPRGVRRARLAVAAGGLAAVTIDGVAVGGEELSPGLTDYAERVPYVVHDVTELVRPGPITLAAALGRGFFGMTTVNTWTWHTAPWHGEPRVRMLLIVEHDEGTLRVGSDPGFRTARGGTLADSFYEGEVFDARREPHGWRLGGFDDGDWEPAARLDAPAGVLRSRPFPGIRVVETLPVQAAEQRADGGWTLDFGRQSAGRLRVSLPAGLTPGHEVRLRATERLVDGRPVLTTPFSEGELQLDRLVSDGEALTWEPSFGYKGFRYVDVEGWPDGDPVGAIEARVLHSDLERTARFTSSDPRLDWMHEAVVATMRDNLHHIPTDTPVFEKNGWTGDAALGAEMMLRDLDSAGLLEDWLQSISESRDDEGRPALIAPSPDWYWPDHMESPPWHAAYWTIPWRLYEATGDDRALRRHAEGIVRYLRLEHARLVDGLASTGLGDYLSPDKSGNPDEDLRVCATVAVHDGTRIGARIARMLGDSGLESEMLGRADELRAAFRREFWDSDRGVVRDAIAGYRQTHNVLAIDSGMLAADESARAAAALARDVDEHRDGHLWVGALGVRRALPVLSDAGFAATAFRAATATGFPGWMAWRDAGATTMWEYWGDQRSRDHYFFGTVDDWLFRHVAGLRPLEPGYRRIAVRPDHLEHVERVRAELRTVRGDLVVEYEREGADGVLRLELPVGTGAEVTLPDSPTRAATGRTEFRFTLPRKD